MKKLFYLLAAVSLVLFVYSAVHLGQQFSHPVLPHFGEIKGFEDVNPSDEYNQLIEKFKQKIASYNNQADHDQSLYFWMSFIVTALTAASTLVSSIRAAKSKGAGSPALQGISAIIIAILTFCSTLTNFASTHFNDLKTEETKKASDLVTMRNRFYADYEKAATSDKSSIIKTYDQRLD